MDWVLESKQIVFSVSIFAIIFLHNPWLAFDVFVRLPEGRFKNKGAVYVAQ